MTDFDRVDEKLARLEGLSDLLETEVGPQICEIMRDTAVTRITMQQAVDTGRLRASVETAEDIIASQGDARVDMGIATNVEYAKYIEFGTGPNGNASYGGHTTEGVTFGTRDSWTYKDDFGQWHLARAQHPRPFMRPALYDNVEVFKGIISGAIKEVMGR